MFIDRGKSLVHKSGYSFLMQKTSGTLPFWEDSPILKSTFAVASPWGCFKLWTPAVSVRLKQKPRQPGCFSRGVCNGSSVCLQQLSKYVRVGNTGFHGWILSTNDLGILSTFKNLVFAKCCWPSSEMRKRTSSKSMNGRTPATSINIWPKVHFPYSLHRFVKKKLQNLPPPRGSRPLGNFRPWVEFLVDV